ncbi:DUF2243 domain-containing protein (plasmid) [Haladaptatus sp. SPP-AMP-3]|uniref:DUF2243 domain-containing protein n=1 Tax=Haladaptatus sp. SPP-AMP-3 TaxID=3121295 RepID=UPI003C2FCC3B
MSHQRDAFGGVTRRALLAAGIFGFGFSGLIDVLVLHLVLQWHHLVSGLYPQTTMAGLRTNMLADGLFSITMVVIMGIGGGLLWRAERRAASPLPVRPIAGSAVVGLGTFDLYDVLVDHVLLGLHQPLSRGGRYNPHWIVVSLLIIGAGLYVYRTGSSEGRETPSENV